MDRYETTASKAETEIFKILSADGQVYRPWQLTGYDLQTRTLKTTSDEVKLLLEREAYLRPGFKVENGTVYVPNLFVKLSGRNDNKYLQRDFCAQDGTIGGFCQFYSSIRDFSDITSSFTSTKIPEILNEKGLIDQQKLMESGIYRYRFLRIEYQKIVIDKINYIIEHRKNLFLSQIDTDNLYKMIFVLLNIDENLMILFNNFDFQYHLPKVIIENGDRSSFTDDKAYVLILLNLLGFDIIIYSAQSFADVENVLNRDLFDIFYSESFDLQGRTNLSEKTGRKHFAKRHRLLFIALLSLTVVFFTTFIIIGNYPDKAGIEPPGTGYGTIGAIMEATVSAGTVAEEPENIETPQSVNQEKRVEINPDSSAAANPERPTSVNAEGPVKVDAESPETGMAVLPLAVMAEIPDGVKTETFNASDFVPIFRGTITKVYLPAENVDPNIDDVCINWIKPENLRAGEETNVMIEVEYSLVSEDGANLSINYNNNETHSGYQMENCRFQVSKGTGMCIFYIPVTPKSWSDGTPFRINSALNHFEDPDPEKHNAFIAGTDLIPLEIK